MVNFSSGTPQPQTMSGVVPSLVPQAERLSLQTEMCALVDGLERAHNILDSLLSVGQAPSNTPTPAEPPVTTSVQQAQRLVANLNERLDGMASAIGQL